MGVLSRYRGSAPRAAADGVPLRLDNDGDVSTILRVTGGGVSTTAGASVGPDSALKCSLVYDCVRVLAEDVAKLPLILYRKTKDGGKERAADHPLYGVMHDTPNRYQTSFEFREMMEGHLALRGNAYALVNRLGTGEVAELLPLHPDKVTAKQHRDWSVTYRVSGEAEDRPASDVLHLRGLSSDGLRGISVISLARESIGLALATEQHGARFFSGAARPSGVLSYPKKFADKEMAERVKASWESSVGGENMHRTALLEDGMTWTQVGMTNDDAQFLGTREFQAFDIPRWFRMQPHKVGIMARATFSNIEHQALEYVVDTLMPWLTRWEQRLNATLLTARERRDGYFFEFLVEGLLRGDIKSRMEAYVAGIQNGIWSPNEVRIKENANPRPGGDEYFRPLNMASSTRASSAEEQAKAVSMAAYLAARDRGGDVDEAARASVAAYRAALAA